MELLAINSVRLHFLAGRKTAGRSGELCCNTGPDARCLWRGEALQANHKIL